MENWRKFRKETDNRKTLREAVRLAKHDDVLIDRSFKPQKPKMFRSAVKQKDKDPFLDNVGWSFVAVYRIGPVWDPADTARMQSPKYWDDAVGLGTFYPKDIPGIKEDELVASSEDEIKNLFLKTSKWVVDDSGAIQKSHNDMKLKYPDQKWEMYLVYANESPVTEFSPAWLDSDFARRIENKLKDLRSGGTAAWKAEQDQQKKAEQKPAGLLQKLGIFK